MPFLHILVVSLMALHLIRSKMPQSTQLFYRSFLQQKEKVSIEALHLKARRNSLKKPHILNIGPETIINQR